MQYLSEITQEVIAAHLLDHETGRPIQGVPVFGELAIYSDSVTPAGIRIDPGWVDMATFQSATFRAVGEQQLARWFTAAEWAELGEDEQRRIVFELQNAALAEEEFFQRPRARQAERLSRELTTMLGEPSARPQQLELRRSLPLGQLATDHEGYVSFSPRRVAQLVDAGEIAVPLIRVGSPSVEPLNLLLEGRVTPDVVLGRLAVLNGENLAPASTPAISMQDPSLNDWYLSPGSFALPSHALIGEDGTENLLPADVARYDFTLRQVQRLSDGVLAPDGLVDGFVDDYEVTWYPIGHSLGKILSSIGLAPGESVKMAIIDWSWESSTARQEGTSLDEYAMHSLYRDRLIAETMSASLDEWQRGGSFMTGHAGSGGGAGSYGSFGFAAGVADAIGGAYSTSSGSRDLAAETAQRLADSIAQSSSSTRDLQSAVVVQARQEEKESVQTRTYTNYNHAHTLNLLHYEILQHYRVSTRWVRRRPAVLVHNALPEWTAELARANRWTIEPFVPPAIAAPGFAALDKHLQVTTDDTVNPVAGTSAPTQPRDYDLVAFNVKVKVSGEESTNGVHLEARMLDGSTIPLLYDGNWNLNKDELFDNDGEYPLPLTPAKSIKWGELLGFDMYKNDGDDLKIDAIGITAMGAFPPVELRPYVGPPLTFIDGGKKQFLSSKPADPDIPITPSPPTGRRRLTPEENGAFERLIEHLRAFSESYWRLVRLTRHPDAWTMILKAKKWNPKVPLDQSTILDHVKPWPLETFGDMVAFERVDSDGIDDDLIAPPDKAPAERLVTLPTRGVFTEGKLGHGNVAEEIDNTRFWKWDEHPIPIEAPDIAPVTTVTPTPQPIQVTPTAFPAPIVTITSPPEAPAPTGLGPALQALTAANVFRDMSGRAEVAGLLKELSENTIKIADAANKAKEIQNKYGAELDKNATEVDKAAIEAASQVAQKEIESQAQVRAAEAREKNAQASHEETKTAQAQLEAAKDMPPSYRPPVYQAAAQQLSGNASKKKTVIFRALGFDGQRIDTDFELTVRDVVAGKNVIEQTVGGYGDKTVDFATAAVSINAGVVRKGTVPVKIFDTIVQVTPVDVVNDQTHAVAAAHRIIDVTLRQGSTKVDFRASSSDQAVNEFLSKVGGELGIDKVVAAKLIASYEAKTGITHANNQEKAYSVNVPSESYTLTITSR